MRKSLAILLAIVLVLSAVALVACDNPGKNEPRYVDLYALNDLHGATSKLAKIGGYLKEKKQQDPNTVLLSSGDMFQETLESNSNYGTLVNSCLEEIGFECMAIGNHEFDWGLDKLKALKTQTSIKFLGAN
ncbi:MAG: metallophosphoesterase, partial [Clostridia bacterium]|nr:metallophosphoesterase [Clostridia bacterium]